MNNNPGIYTGDPAPRTMLVEGAFGTGKTSFAIETLYAWLESGIPPENILVLVPQRSLALKYMAALRDTSRGPSGMVQVRTLGGLAKTASEQFWPLAAEPMGFTDLQKPKRFLTIETSQYVMAGFVNDAVQFGEFDAVKVSPQQIARQVIDNLGKAALMGIDYHHVPDLLEAAWGTERPVKRVYAYRAAGKVAQAFREHCLENRLLDYSLQIEIFRHLLHEQVFQEKFLQQYSHLVVEHLEEESALTHSLLRQWMPGIDGGLFIYETDSGYRVVLGADPSGAEAFRHLCDGVLRLEHSYVTNTGLDALLNETAAILNRPDASPPPEASPLAFSYKFHSFFPQMLDWVANQIYSLVHNEGVPPGEIAILAPYLSDALRFSLGQKLDAIGIPHISHRPSRALRDEPAARTVLTLASLAHPQWGHKPPAADVAQALHTAITGLDPIRAGMLGKVIYRPGSDEWLSSFDQIRPNMQTRITHVAGERYEYLREWVEAYQAGPVIPLDQFFRKLFGEVLSQPGFGFHTDIEAGRITSELVESAQKFRQSLFEGQGLSYDDVGRQYFDIVREGLLAALYLSGWQDEQADAVFMSPAYTFLMRNRAVRIQFWLDVGSIGWWERLDQPLTHPYVLSPSWPEGEVWQDADEYQRQQDMLYRIISGLIRRTSDHIYLGIADLSEQGFEQRGPLLRIFQQILRRHPQPELPELSYD